MSEVSLYVNSVFECLRQVFVEILAENGNVPPINGNPSRVSQDGLVSYTNLRIDRQVATDKDIYTYIYIYTFLYIYIYIDRCIEIYR